MKKSHTSKTFYYIKLQKKGRLNISFYKILNHNIYIMYIEAPLLEDSGDSWSILDEF